LKCNLSARVTLKSGGKHGKKRRIKQYHGFDLGTGQMMRGLLQVEIAIAPFTRDER
jgi:hypothetical protein